MLNYVKQECELCDNCVVYIRIEIERKRREKCDVTLCERREWKDDAIFVETTFSIPFLFSPSHEYPITFSPLFSPFLLYPIFFRSISPLCHLHFTSPSSPFHLSVISISSLSSGMIESAVEAIKASLDDLPGLPRTYFGDFHTIHTILLIHSLIVMCSGDFPCFKC